MIIEDFTFASTHLLAFVTRTASLTDGFSNDTCKVLREMFHVPLVNHSPSNSFQYLMSKQFASEFKTISLSYIASTSYETVFRKLARAS